MATVKISDALRKKIVHNAGNALTAAINAQVQRVAGKADAITRVLYDKLMPEELRAAWERLPTEFLNLDNSLQFIFYSGGETHSVPRCRL